MANKHIKTGDRKASHDNLKMGRPTYYCEELEAQAWRYVDAFEEHGHAFPSIVGLCKVLNRGKTTIYKWAEDENKNFRDILDAIKENQELVTFNKAMLGEYNATIAKLLLGKHGYNDKVDSNNISSDRSMSPSRIELVAPAINVSTLSDNTLAELLEARNKLEKTTINTGR